MRMGEPFLDQGYHFYFNNFYPSPAGGKSWARHKERGDMRWERDVPVLSVQWKETK